ncbi:MAG: hydrolase family protein [Satyrvirus sp.]|uniref:Hydrolase family protein n=1 Tax=Satyrvirus sp. TaxID=2487771 RepID=A0A3G5AGK4_9VIRU|nr:MAG: hydrolase family protein [Satyrvirus sp.]
MYNLIRLLMFIWSLIDEWIDSYIFQPPLEDDSMFGCLNTYRSKLKYVLTKNKHVVSFVEIHPEKRQYNVVYKNILIYSHGNRGTIIKNFDYFKKLSDDLDICIIVYDYIGYGLSEKIKPSEQYCYDSLEAVVNYVEDYLRINKSNIYLFGRSLGTGVVVDYASKHEWYTPIILISPYKSIYSIVIDTQYKFLANLLSFLIIIDKFASLNKLNKIRCPIKIFHGTNDRIVNITHSIILAENMVDKHFKPTFFINADHDNILQLVTSNYYLEVLHYDDF